jgi:hypothetical protein
MTKRTVTTKRTNGKAKERKGGKPIPFRPTNGIERAAERAGIKATPPAGELPDISELDAIGVGLTDEDKALIAQRAEESGRQPKVAEYVMRSARVNGNDTRGVSVALRRAARDLTSIAERLTVPPETRDSMLADALEVIEAAESIFYVNGIHGSNPDDIMAEALSSLEQDLDVLGEHAESCDSKVPWQKFWRARHQAALAIALADFRKKHGIYKPTTKTEKSDDDSAAVAS